jgi:ADP-ribosyl-[dinitrogen reductase] hydrolase
MHIDLRSRFHGALLGLACGDAVGTTVEFSPRGSFAPMTDMVGGGPFGLSAGQWTDDTSMALCLGESLLARDGFDAKDQMARYLNWWKWGYLSATGECFDIGITVRNALSKFEQSGEPFSGSTDPKTAGNGSLMRLVPAVLFAYPNLQNGLHCAAESSRTTHAAPEALESCALFANLLHRVLSGCEKHKLFVQLECILHEPKLVAMATGDFIAKNANQIRGNGYCVDSLEAALWCFFNTDTFDAAVLKAANLGDDADTTAAIVGQIAGAFYGVEAIPAHWLARLSMREDIAQMADNFYLRLTK